MEQYGLSESVREKFGLPLRGIVDTVHFAAKPDARALQLADLCAFTMARKLKAKHVPPNSWRIILRHRDWIKGWRRW